jgi:hypothetical protein
MALHTNVEHVMLENFLCGKKYFLHALTSDLKSVVVAYFLWRDDGYSLVIKRHTVTVYLLFRD